jgi:CRP-like cAMP-binding protein
MPGMAERRFPILDHWLLAGVPTQQLQPLLTNAHEVRFLRGEVIFEEGDRPDGLYLISDGSVRVTASNERGEVLLATIGANNVLGEMGILDGEPRSGTATAIEPCTAYYVGMEPFLDTLELSPQLCMRLLALMTDRLRLANEPLKRYASLAAADDPFTAQSDARPSREARPPAGDPVDLQIGREPKGFYTPETESFYDWLVQRIGWGDLIGDLARYASDDPGWPRNTDDVEVIRLYMETRNAEPSAVRALNSAWRAWSIASRRAELAPGFEDV